MKCLLLILTVLAAVTSSAQSLSNLSNDELYDVARAKAVAGPRTESRSILKILLAKSPGHTDGKILLARTYGWDHYYDSARTILEQLIAQDPKNLEAYSAWTDVEMWDRNFAKLSLVCVAGLQYFPNDDELLYKLAASFFEQGFIKQSLEILNVLLTTDPGHEKGLILLRAIKSSKLKYQAGISYGLDVFSTRFKPAQYSSVQLTRLNRWGSSTVRLNYAHRFQLDGWQPEIDLYPRISRSTYGYLNYGYSNAGLFPTHRVAAEVFTKAARGLEVSGGFRYLNFGSQNKVWMYTGSINWYFRDYLLLLRPYVTHYVNPGTPVSGTFALRKYFASAESFIALTGGIGFQPDVRRIQTGTGLTSDEIFVLNSQKVGLALQQTSRRNFIFNLSADLNHQELSSTTQRYLWITSLNIGIRRKF